MAEDYRRQRLTLRRHPMALLRPGSAKGVIFATLEDETGIANIIVWPKVFETYRATVMRTRLLYVEGKLQKEGLVIHVVANHIEDRSYLLADLDGPLSDAMQP